MTELQDGLRLQGLINGKRQVTLSKLNGKIVSGAQAIETFEGLIGKTPGAGRTTWTGSAAIPASGQEFDYWSAVAKGTYATMQVPVGPKSYIGNGWFDDCELDQSTGSGAEVSFTWIGAFQPLK